MKCPTCQMEGERSKVYPGGSRQTLAYSPPMYDEDGKLHIHNPNTVATNYTCSRGHTWTGTAGGSCWCGWPQKGEHVP
jgi:hypothetical protein